jgi:glycosyltransferase involved in cell wall biosynthesis
MPCPELNELPSPPPGKTGWPWTVATPQLSDTMPDGHLWPRISIVTPSLNSVRFIEASIRSVLLQGYPDLEYIIMDGGSNDGSVEVIRKYERWLSYWESRNDRGQSHAINKGLKRSTGRLFNWHNADDMLTPNSLATTASAIMKHGDASYVRGHPIVIDDRAHILPHIKGRSNDKRTSILEPAGLVSNLKGGCQPGCLMDRDLVVESGMVDEGLEFVMDQDLTLRMALLRPPLYVSYPVVFFRKHPQSKSILKEARRAKERLIIAHKIFDNRDLPISILKVRRKAFATAHRYAWKWYAEADMYGRTLWHLLQDILYAPCEGDWGARRAILRKAACELSRGVRKMVVDQFLRRYNKIPS